MAGSIRWDRDHKLVVMEMPWQDARDLGYFLIEQGDPDGKLLVNAALEGAGFFGVSV